MADQIHFQNDVGLSLFAFSIKTPTCSKECDVRRTVKFIWFNKYFAWLQDVNIIHDLPREIHLPVLHIPTQVLVVNILFIVRSSTCMYRVGRLAGVMLISVSALFYLANVLK